MALSASMCISCGASNPAKAKFCPACGNPLRYNNYNRPSAPTGLLPSPYTLNQRFRVTAKVGQGGFGAVYKAEDLHLDNAPRAIKEMNQQSQSPQELQQEALAFKQEALLLASLMHPNLPRIYDHFEVNGHWYLVMDYIEGETLASRLQNISGGKLPVSEVLHIGIQLATVLGYLHTRQPPIIFRDLKPANVMLTADNHLYLIDFGIARLFKPGQTKDTQALGSPGYASPEQYGRAQTTEQADIYSLGVTLHQLLSGYDPQQDPFHLPPLVLEPSSPAGRALETLIMRMVEMAKEKRPATMQEVKQELLHIGQATQLPLRGSYQAPALPHIAELRPRTSMIVDQHGRGDYTTISDAIKHAPPGARIAIRPGVYREGIILQKQLKIVGDGPREQIIVENVDASCVHMSTSSALIRGLTLRSKVSERPCDHCAVNISKGQLKLSDCDISSESLGGIAIHHATSEPLIQGCTIHHCIVGIFVYDDGRGTIEDCELHTNARASIAISQDGNPTIRRCRIYHGEHSGISIHDHGQGIIEECDIYQNVRAGITIMQGSTPTIKRCKIHDSRQFGILVQEYGRGTIEYCDIYKNTRAGIGIGQGSDPQIQWCTIHDELQYGILVRTHGQGTIKNCDIESCFSAGINIIQDGNPFISRCRIYDGMQAGIYIHEHGRSTIEDCDIFANGTAGLVISRGGNPVVRQCKINDSKHYGIIVRTHGQGTIEHCTLMGNRAGAWNIEAGCRVRRHKNSV